MSILPYLTWRKYRLVRILSRGIILIIFYMVAHTLPGLCQPNTVSITIKDIRSDSGVVRLALYNHPDQFPHQPARSFTFEKTILKDGIMEVVLIDIPPGIYAISLLDDEDENDCMNYNFLRMPREGYGFSNNVRPGLKSPPFDKCTFRVGEGNTHLEIEMQYFVE